MSDRRPNILFLFSDEHRGDWLGCHGTVPVRTPHIDALAARGVRFTRAWCNSPMCAPSRACLATALRYHRVGVPDNTHDLSLEHPTFMQALRAVGYRVGMVGKSDLSKKSHHYGITGWHEHHGRLGFTEAVDTAGKRDSGISLGYPTPIEPYMAYLHSKGVAKIAYDDMIARSKLEKDEKLIDASPFPLPRDCQNDDFVSRCALDMLGNFAPHQPWFIQVNLGSPHPPWDACQELLDRYDGVEFPTPVDPADDANDHQAIRRNYAAQIDGMDEWVGRLIDKVDQRGELDNTLIVYSSDHGEILGDHGRFLKGFPDEASIHIPLVIAGPGVREGVVSNSPVELGDVAATFVDIANASWPDRANVDGRSLLPTLADGADHRDVMVSAFGWWCSICDGRWKLIVEDSGPRLYDSGTDPGELHNVANEQPEIVARLTARLEQETGNG